MNDYEKQANDFATKYGVTLSVIGQRYGKHFSNDEQNRFVFKLALQRIGKKSCIFEFGQSIAAGNQQPTMYDVLACLEKNEPESFESFCSDFGYEQHNEMYTGVNRESKRIYNAVCKEYEAIERLFSDVMEELYKIA